MIVSGLTAAPASARRSLRRALLSLAAAAALATAAPARENERPEPPNVATPFDVSNTLSANYLAALSAAAQSDTHAAATYFREVLRRDPNNAMVLERAFVSSLSNGDMREAFAFAEQILKRDQKNGLANLTLGVRAIKQKQFATARTYFSRAQINQRGDLTGTLLMAWTWLGSGNAQRAIHTVDELKNPAVALFRNYHAGLIAAVAGQHDEATKRLKSVYDGDKSVLRMIDAYARNEYRAGRKDEALAIYKAFEQTAPRHPYVQAAIAAINAGKPLPPMIRDAIDGAAETLYDLGSLSAQGDRNLGVSVMYLRLSLYLAPQQDLAIINLADIFERMKQYERAIDVYATMPADSSLRSNAELRIGLALEMLERKQEAVDYLRKIVDRSPDDPEAVTALADIYRSRKDYADAVKLYDSVLDKPGADKERANWALFYYRAVSNERLKNWDVAEKDFKKALELFPDQPNVLNYLGYSWVDRGANLDEAFKMLRRAVELRPTSGDIVDSLGWAYYRLGKYEDALRELERAIELKPSEPVINDHLGDVYWKVGRRLEAVFQWNHARDLKPDPEDLPRILRKIEVGLDVVEQEEAARKRADNKDAPPALPAGVAPASPPAAPTAPNLPPEAPAVPKKDGN